MWLIQKGTTEFLLPIFVTNSSDVDGAGLTGLAFNTAGLTWVYYRQGDTSVTTVTKVNGTFGTWASGGFEEVDSSGAPGAYELGVPNAVFAAGASYAVMILKGATNMVPVPILIRLTDESPYSGRPEDHRAPPRR